MSVLNVCIMLLYILDDLLFMVTLFNHFVMPSLPTLFFYLEFLTIIYEFVKTFVIICNLFHIYSTYIIISFRKPLPYLVAINLFAENVVLPNKLNFFYSLNFSIIVNYFETGVTTSCDFSILIQPISCQSTLTIIFIFGRQCDDFLGSHFCCFSDFSAAQNT